MARAASATIDGIVVGYGTRDTYNPQAAEIHTLGRLKQVVVEIDVRNYLSFATDTAVSSKNFPIPSGAIVRSASWVTKVAWNTLTSIVVGLKVAAGTTNDADGLIASTALASFNDIGETVEGAGAHVDGPALTAASYPSMDVTGSAPTTGHAVLTIVYEEPVPAQAAPAVITGVI